MILCPFVSRKRVYCLVDHHMNSECNPRPMTMGYTYSFNNSVSMTRNKYILWIYMCQWHRLVSDMSWFVPMTRYRIFCEFICVNDTESYILWIYMCQWHGIVYSMNIYVSMTQNCIFYEYICVNYMKWDCSTMSKNWPSAILIVCDRLGQPYDVWLV